MKIFRNSEVTKSLGSYVVVSGLAVMAAFCMDRRFALFTLTVCVIFVFIHVFSTYKRYQKISDLSEDINRILHGDSQVLIEKCEEGELGILESEIYKMTVRLREQQHRLKEDKVFLADSIADISHQLRTPLTSINLLLSFLSEPDISKERKQKLIHEIYGLLSRIDWLITALLKISKLDAGTIQFNSEKIPLKELINKATESLLVPLELHEIQLKVEAEGTFIGDVSWTQEAITNIVKNCMEHTPNGGEIQIVALENPLYSQMIISDNGSGIDKADLPHIFERFYKGKKSDAKSFGIGLALARMIISAQKGTVKAENNKEKGAKFTIRFYKGAV